MVYFGHVQEKLDSSPVRGQNWYSLSQSWGPILLVKYQFRQEHMTQLWPETSGEVYLGGEGKNTIHLWKTEEVMFILFSYTDHELHTCRE